MYSIFYTFVRYGHYFKQVDTYYMGVFSFTDRNSLIELFEKEISKYDDIYKFKMTDDSNDNIITFTYEEDENCSQVYKFSILPCELNKVVGNDNVLNVADL